MRKIDGSAPRGVQGRRPWVAVWFQECDLPVLLSLEMAAKSFVLRRWPNFYFSRPHNLFRGEEFAGCQRASLRYATPVFLSRLMALANFMRLSSRKAAHAAVSSAAWKEIRVRSGPTASRGRRDDKVEGGATGVGVLGHVSIAVTRCWGFERLLRIEFPVIQGMPSRHDRQAALSSQRTSDRLYPCRNLICYLYRCELGWLRLFFSTNLRIRGSSQCRQTECILDDRPRWTTGGGACPFNAGKDVSSEYKR